MWFDDLSRLRHWNPARDLRRIQRELNHLLEGNLGSILTNHPPINIYCDEERLTVEVEVPGITPAELDVSILRKTLTIKGCRQADELDENDMYHRHERRSGSFARTVDLPFEVNTDEVHAVCHQGILRLELPRSDRDKPRRIDVKTTS